MIRKYITDDIGTDYTLWKGGDLVYITAPTGSGKTSFILNVLMKYAATFCLTILLVVNRQSLRLQIKKQLADRKSIPYRTLDELDKMTTFGNLTILTYQHLEQCIVNKSNISLYNMGVNQWFDYIVFDEAHYFVEDSMFNPRTELVFRAQNYHFNRSVRIFISATLNDFIEYNNKLKSSVLGNCFFPRPRQIWEYSIPADYSNYNVSYFKDFAEICNRINQDTTDDKWIIFVSNKVDADYIKKQIDAKFISADTKNNMLFEEGQIYEQILREQKFNRKVVIATSVIDNGINLLDEKLRNIVISTLSRTQFLQMLGRKRADEAPINLFIDSKSLTGVSCYKSLQINKMIRMIYLYRDGSFKALQSLFNDPCLFLQFHSLFRFDGSDFKLNEIAAFKIFKTNDFCKRIIKRFKDEGSAGYIKEQLSWLGLEHTYSDKNWLNYEDIQSVKSETKLYLQSKANLPLDKDQQTELREYLTEQFARLYGHAEIERSSRIAGLKIINRILDTNEFGFVINSELIKRKTYWIINTII